MSAKPPSTDAYGAVSGSITSTADRELTDVPIRAIFYDAGGKVVGGDKSFVHSLPSDQAQKFSLNVLVWPPSTAETKVFAQPSKSDLGLDDSGGR